MSRWDSISTMAHYTAQIWVRHNLPWAWYFDTPTGRLLYSATLPLFELASRAGLTTPMEFCLQRHRVIDALVDSIGPTQLVELGGGLGPRALALAHKRDVPCIDVDLPHVTRAKRKLVGADLPRTYRTADLDIVDCADYVDGLSPALEKLPNTVVVVEGLLSYFTLDQQQQVFSRVADLLRWCGGGTLLCDVHHEQAVQQLGPVAALFRSTLHAVSRTQQTAFIHDFAQGRQMLSDAGFTATTGHAPADWQQRLGLPQRNLDSGLTIYEATVAPPVEQP